VVLTRARIIGYDADSMMFNFTMMTPDARMVRCQISSIAMDQLDSGRGTLPSERQAQFIRLREAIEGTASDIFEAEGTVQGNITRIFKKHLLERRARKVHV
jgi:Protein of unknown function (DUF1488)